LVGWIVPKVIWCWKNVSNVSPSWLCWVSQYQVKMKWFLVRSSWWRDETVTAIEDLFQGFNLDIYQQEIERLFNWKQSGFFFDPSTQATNLAKWLTKHWLLFCVILPAIMQKLKRDWIVFKTSFFYTKLMEGGRYHWDSVSCSVSISFSIMSLDFHGDSGHLLVATRNDTRFSRAFYLFKKI
jgi:hypothetical protein